MRSAARAARGGCVGSCEDTLPGSSEVGCSACCVEGVGCRARVETGGELCVERCWDQGRPVGWAGFCSSLKVGRPGACWTGWPRAERRSWAPAGARPGTLPGQRQGAAGCWVRTELGPSGGDAAAEKQRGGRGAAAGWSCGRGPRPARCRFPRGERGPWEELTNLRLRGEGPQPLLPCLLNQYTCAGRPCGRCCQLQPRGSLAWRGGPASGCRGPWSWPRQACVWRHGRSDCCGSCGTAAVAAAVRSVQSPRGGRGRERAGQAGCRAQAGGPPPPRPAPVLLLGVAG